MRIPHVLILIIISCHSSTCLSPFDSDLEVHVDLRTWSRPSISSSLVWLFLSWLSSISSWSITHHVCLGILEKLLKPCLIWLYNRFLFLFLVSVYPCIFIQNLLFEFNHAFRVPVLLTMPSTWMIHSPKTRPRKASIKHSYAGAIWNRYQVDHECLRVIQLARSIANLVWLLHVWDTYADLAKCKRRIKLTLVVIFQAIVFH